VREGFMKKIILVVIFLFVGMVKVGAKEIYYSEYGNFSDYLLQPYQSSELVNVETERRYRYYDEVKIGQYKTYLDDVSNFNFIDFNDMKNNDFSKWSDEKPKEQYKRIIETKTFYKVKRPKPVKNINFINTLEGTIELNNIEVYYLNEKIDYESSIENGEEYRLNFWDSLTLDLRDYYDLQKLIIKIGNVEFNGLDELLITAAIPSDDNSYQINYFSVNLNNDNTKNIVLNADDWIKANPDYYEEEIVDNKENADLSIINEVILYRYQDPLFYFYNIEKRYVDGYFVDYPGMIKDENDYQDYYRYQVRDKVEVSKEIVVDNYNQQLSDFINSTVDYDIITNLDINKNGIYQVNYKTDFVDIKKEVRVNIKENDLKESRKEYEQLNSELNNLKQQYEIKQFELNEIKNNYEELLVDNNNLNLELENVKKENLNLVNICDDYDNISYVLNQYINKYNILQNENNKLKQQYYNLLDINEKYILDNENLNFKFNTVQNENEKLKIDLNDIKNNSEILNKKLNLSKQAYKYLQSHFLKINNEKSRCLNKINLFWIILISVILICLIIIFIKKLSNKNKG